MRLVLSFKVFGGDLVERDRIMHRFYVERFFGVFRVFFLFLGKRRVVRFFSRLFGVVVLLGFFLFRRGGVGSVRWNNSSLFFELSSWVFLNVYFVKEKRSVELRFGRYFRE